MSDFLFTSESVSMGHPDKVSDQISDGILDALIAVDAQSFCEWKGTARYWDVTDGQPRVARAAWSYPDAGDRFAAIAGCIAFYCDRLDCRVDGLLAMTGEETTKGMKYTKKTSEN